MKLFEFLASQLEGSDKAIIVAMKTADGRLSVSVTPQCKNANRHAPFAPPVVTGTAEELDERLVGAIQESIKTEVGLQVSIAEHDKSVKASQEALAKETAAKKKTDAKKPATPAVKTDAKKEEDEPAAEAEEKAPELSEEELAAKKKAEEAEKAKAAEAEATATVSKRWPEFMKAKAERRFKDGLDILKELEKIAVKEEQKAAIARGIALCETELAQPELGL